VFALYNIRRAFGVTGIWPLNGRRVLESRFGSESHPVTHSTIVLSTPARGATPRHTRAVHRVHRSAVGLVKRDTPDSWRLKSYIGQLGRVGGGNRAECQDVETNML